MDVEFLSTITQVPASQWDELFPSYPFTQHAFLSALEASGCVSAESGWQPHHCLVRQNNQLIAAAPLYIKSHSYGEYVFDWSWANAYAEYGLNYYPKLVNAIPFTPCSGPRWGCALAEEERQALAQIIQATILTESNRLGCSSAHRLFSESPVDSVQENDSWLTRWDCQYHWLNHNFAAFDEYLQTFASRKRKTLVKERKKIAQQNIRIEIKHGTELNAEDWQYFYLLYRQTYLKRSGHSGYLNDAFFQLIGKNLAPQIVMVRAFIDDSWIAAALFFFDNSTLYGRYWGCAQEFDALHFECCYYQGIEFAISKKLQRFDPGAQGEHKISRGFQPVLTCSQHYIHHPGFARAIRNFVDEEKKHVLEHSNELRERLPFKEGIALASVNSLLKQDLF